MAQFSRRTEARGDGIPPSRWVDEYLPSGGTGANGNGQVLATMSNGTERLIDVKNACIVFTDPQIMRKENRSNTGNAPAVTGKVIGYADAREAFQARYKIKPHHLFKYGMVSLIVPIFHTNGAKTQNVTMQCGSAWVGAGEDNYGYDAHHVASMYLYSIQSVIWDLMNEKEQKRMVTLADMCTKLISSAKAYFRYDEKSFEIIEPLKDCEDAIDMLNRAVAFIFFEDKWSKLDLLRILEISLKKWKKYNADKDFVTEPILGIYGILIAVPILRDFSNGLLNDEKSVKTINDRLMKMLQVTTENIGQRGENLNKIIWFELCKLSSVLNLKRAQSDLFYDFCMVKKNFHKFAPFEDWKVVEKPVIPFEAGLDGFRSGRHPAMVSKLVVHDREGKEPTYRVTSTNPAKWAGFGLKTAGKYNFTGKPVSGANFAEGNSQGQQRVCNCRFLLGTDVLPNVGEGKSSAGMLREQVHGTWTYTNTYETLDLRNFEIKIDPNGSFEISQFGRRWYQREQTDFKQCVLIGYKFLDFQIEFEPIGEKDHVVEEIEPGADESIDLNGLTPSALLQTLAKIALKERQETS